MSSNRMLSRGHKGYFTRCRGKPPAVLEQLSEIKKRNHNIKKFCNQLTKGYFYIIIDYKLL
jgi:phage/plasmid-associated DNA primase